MDWKAIRSVMVKDDFVQRILNFDTDSITPETLKAMEKYTQNPDWDFDKAWELLGTFLIKKLIFPIVNKNSSDQPCFICVWSYGEVG